MVSVTGLEPAQTCVHSDLNAARLPIPPHRLIRAAAHLSATYIVYAKNFKMATNALFVCAFVSFFADNNLLPWENRIVCKPTTGDLHTHGFPATSGIPLVLAVFKEPRLLGARYGIEPYLRLKRSAHSAMPIRHIFAPMVEVRGVEPLSESTNIQPSTSVGKALTFPPAHAPCQACALSSLYYKAKSRLF